MRNSGTNDARNEAALNLLAEIFKNDVTNHPGNDGNHEIGDRENILNGKQ